MNKAHKFIYINLTSECFKLMVKQFTVPFENNSQTWIPRDMGV